MTVAFASYGAVFSRETRQPIAIDPHVFIKAAGAVSGIGPGGIAHAAGLTPAPLEDPPNSRLYAADGRPLQITLGQWTAARGTATIVPLGSGIRISTDFRNLIARGSYSLFRVSRNGNRSTAAPFDGTGTTNNLVAAPDGTGSLTVTAGALGRGQVVVLVYHSDGAPHAMSEGVPGLTAHYQLVARSR